MASIRVRKETGLLYFDFQYRKIRCREQSTLPDTPKNRAVMESALKEIMAAIQGGSFRYRDAFPHSRLLSKIESVETQREVDSQQPALAASTTQTTGAASDLVDSVAGPIFAEFAEQFLQENQAVWKRSHQKTKRGIVDQWLMPTFGKRAISAITKKEILDFRTLISTANGKQSGSSLSASRINHIMTTLKQILDEAADRHDFTTPYHTSIKRIRGKRSDVDPFSLSEVERIIQKCRSDYRNYFLVRFFTGMRTGEIHGLKWEFVDFQRRLILIRETIVDDYTETPKTEDSVRDIQMSPQVYRALIDQYQQSASRSKYVFCNERGGPIANRNFSNRIWYPTLRLLGLKDRNPYQTRHTFATLMLAAGEAPEWIANQMGHCNTQMLFKTYSRYVPNLTRRDGSAFEKLIADMTSLSGACASNVSPAVDATPAIVVEIPAGASEPLDGEKSKAVQKNFDPIEKMRLKNDDPEQVIESVVASPENPDSVTLAENPWLSMFQRYTKSADQVETRYQEDNQK